MLSTDRYIITSGCSFTAQAVPENLSWANTLHTIDGIWVNNVAEMAAGNTLISHNLIWAIEKNKHLNPFVIVMWSNPNRVDLLLDEYLEGVGQGYQNIVETDNKWYPEISKKNNWLKSGGGFGDWKFDNDRANKLLDIYMKHFHNEEFQFMNTLNQIIKVQHYCKLNNIPYVMISWKNIFSDYNRKDGGFNKLDGETYETGDMLINKFKGCTHLWDMIDWNKWWFYNHYDGYWEWCRDNDNDFSDNDHPSSNASKSFVDNVILKLLND
tara:strand:- start:4697 stop:5500 length:804 start_codon:yes stop_codon:yes gene_type:complete